MGEPRMITGLREIEVKEEDEGETNSEPPSSSDDEDQLFQAQKGSREIPTEYWHIQKLVKYVKAGNQTATVVALSLLLDYDLKNEMFQLAIMDIGGLEVLVNILETNDVKSRLGALTVLSIISDNLHIKRSIADLGGVPILVNTLLDPAKDLQILAAETLANVAMVKAARRKVRFSGGIPKLVDLLDVSDRCLQTPRESLSPDDLNQVAIARAGARALWSLSQSPKNKMAMKKCGIVPLLAKLIKSVHPEVVKSTMGTLQGCASQDSYQLAIKTENMIPDIVRQLRSDDIELREHSASCIFKCAVDEQTREIIRQCGGLDPLVDIISDRNFIPNKSLLASATGAIWRCAENDANVERLDKLGTTGRLAGLLNDENEDVLANVVGALSQMLRFSRNRKLFRNDNGIEKLILLLNGVYDPLLENVPLALMECAEDPDSMAKIDELDGVRLIWSLLKNPSPRVKENAAWALCPCIKNAEESGEMVRSFVGAMELIVELLDHEDDMVLAGICAAIAQIGRDTENLAVMTDHGVVIKLAKLVNTTNETLRIHLADAIAHCCNWADNRREFGELGTISPLVTYMVSSNPELHRTTALALYHLSQDPFSCITMHQSGVVPFLLETVSSKNEELQDSSAGCLCNIRRLALAAEKFNLKQ